MAEMTHASKHHRDTMFIGCSNYFLVTHRAAGMNHGGNACSGCGINTIAEREEGIGGHYGTFNDYVFVLRFDARDFGTVNKTHLTSADTDGAAASSSASISHSMPRSIGESSTSTTRSAGAASGSE